MNNCQNCKKQNKPLNKKWSILKNATIGCFLFGVLFLLINAIVILAANENYVSYTVPFALAIIGVVFSLPSAILWVVIWVISPLKKKANETIESSV